MKINIFEWQNVEQWKNNIVFEQSLKTNSKLKTKISNSILNKGSLQDAPDIPCRYSGFSSRPPQ